MRLLLVTSRPTTTPGGVQTQVRAFARELSVLGTEVVVAAADGPPDDAPPAVDHREVRLARREGPHPARLPRAPHTVGSAWLVGLEDLAASVAPDVVMFASHHSPIAHQCLALARARGIPFAFWPSTHLDAPAHVNRTARGLYAAADLVIATSPLEREWLAPVAGRERVIELTQGATVGEARPPRVWGAPLRLLTVAAFTRHKRLEHVLSTLHALRTRHRLDARLTIAGVDVDPHRRRRLQRQAAELGLASHVALEPDCPEPRLSALHEEADVFLFTSASEAFALTIVEALCRGVPVAVYPHPAYAPLVVASGGGRVAVRETPEALADEVLALLQAPPLLAGSAWRAAHTWPAIARRLQAALAAVVAQQRSSPIPNPSRSA